MAEILQSVIQVHASVTSCSAADIIFLHFCEIWIPRNLCLPYSDWDAEISTWLNYIKALTLKAIVNNEKSFSFFFPPFLLISFLCMFLLYFE